MLGVFGGVFVGRAVWVEKLPPKNWTVSSLWAKLISSAAALPSPEFALPVPRGSGRSQEVFHRYLLLG